MLRISLRRAGSKFRLIARHVRRDSYFQRGRIKFHLVSDDAVVILREARTAATPIKQWA